MKKKLKNFLTYFIGYSILSIIIDLFLFSTIKFEDLNSTSYLLKLFIKSIGFAAIFTFLVRTNKTDEKEN